MQYIFKIQGEPTGKGRPRFTKQGRTYTPKETVTYENWVKLCFKEAYPYATPTGERLRVHIEAYFTIPKSYSKKRRNACMDSSESPTKKPDCDNIAKIILDSLNGIAYLDDKQVVQLDVKKHYSDEPCVVVRIEDF